MDCFVATLLAMTGESLQTSDLPIAPSNVRTTPKQNKAASQSCTGGIHATFASHPGHCRAIRRARRPVAAADARREPPQPSVPDLGAVRGPRAELVLRRISRAGRP